jgi:type I restriction enzyme S subunit
MEHLFTHGTRGEPTKQTEIGEMPESWKVFSFQELCEKVTVGVVVRPSSYYVSSGVPAFRSFNIREDRIDAKDLVFFSHDDNETVLSKSKIKMGDVLIVRTGYTGTAAVVPEEYDGANCIDLVIARPNSSIVESKYLSRYLNSSEGKRQAIASEIGLAQKHLNVGAVNRILVPLPSTSEQFEIAAILEALDNMIAVIDHEAHLLDELFRAMLEELMSGRISTNCLVFEDQSQENSCEGNYGVAT